MYLPFHILIFSLSFSNFFFTLDFRTHYCNCISFINPHIVRWWSSNKNSTSSIPRSKNGKPQKRGKVNLIGRLQLSTEKSKEEDNEGIVQLRILRTQVNICMCLPLSCRKLSIFLFFLPCVLTNIFFH